MKKNELLETGNKVQKYIYLAIQLVVPFVAIGLVVYYAIKNDYFSMLGDQMSLGILAFGTLVVLSYVISSIIQLRRDPNKPKENLLVKLSKRQERKQERPQETVSIDEIREKYRR